MSTWLRRLRYWLLHARHEAELREEMETHRVLRQAALERDGMASAEAAAASRRVLGNVRLAEEDVREVWALRTVDTALQDLRQAIRGLRKSPGFTLVAVATLALGIGANTALFSIFNSLVLRTLPVREPGRLVLLENGSWTYPIWREIDRHSPAIFDGAFAWAPETFDLAQGGRTEPVAGAFVSGGLFQVLGVTAERGRAIIPADDLPGADAGVAVISHRFWQRQFAGDDDVVGRTLTLQRRTFVVIGVAPAGFFGPDVGQMLDVMIPFAAEPMLRGRESVLDGRSTWWLEVMARLKPGETVDEATAALRGIQPAIRAATQPDWPAGMSERYLSDGFTLIGAATGRSSLRQRFETPLSAMVVAVGLVLLVACANIASLMLARALARRREISVRLALGASRWRVARLLFTESLVVALLGAGAGLLFARWSSGLLIAQLNTWQETVSLDLGVDWRVLGFTAALACGCAVVSGLVPLFGLSRVGAGEALKDGGRGSVGDRRLPVRGALVVVQLAISLMLVIAAGLFLRTFASLSSLPLGFAADRLLVAQLDVQRSAVPADERGDVIERLRTAAAGVPGVTSAAISRITPVTGAGWNNWVGDIPAPSDRSLMTWLNAVSPGWFETMGIPLRQGRVFDAADRRGGRRVAIVNERFAARFLDLRRPLVGQTVHLGRQPGPFDVIGVVADAVYRRPREGMMPTLYLPVSDDEPWSGASLTLALAPGQRAAVERQLAATLAQVDPAVTFSFQTFEQLTDATVAQERLVALLSSFFGGLALLLAAIGLYGVVANGVRARRAEIGVRMALGADTGGIVRLVMRRVGLLIATGLVLGLGAGLWAAQYVTSLLFSLDARDPATFAGAAAVLVVVGFLAAWFPARAGGRLDPAAVLRED